MRKYTNTKILLQSTIESAMKCTRSNRSAAMYLRVTYATYKKYALMYKDANGITLFKAHLNQSGLGLYKTRVGESPVAIDDILTGKHRNYPQAKLLRRIITSGYAAEKCGHCGYTQKRPKDLRTPLLLHHINNDNKDHRIDNLEVLCYNCYFVLVGDLKFRDTGAHAPVVADTVPYDIADAQENLDALSTMNMLSDEEKLELIKSLNGI